MSYFSEDFNYDNLMRLVDPNLKQIKAKEELMKRLEKFEKEVIRDVKNGLANSDALVIPEDLRRIDIDSMALELHEKFPNRVEYLRKYVANSTWERYVPELYNSTIYVPMLALRINLE
jgi:hypothetical protein